MSLNCPTAHDQSTSEPALATQTTAGNRSRNCEELLVVKLSHCAQQHRVITTFDWLSKGRDKTSNFWRFVQLLFVQYVYDVDAALASGWWFGKVRKRCSVDDVQAVWRWTNECPVLESVRRKKARPNKRNTVCRRGNIYYLIVHYKPKLTIRSVIPLLSARGPGLVNSLLHCKPWGTPRNIYR